MPTLDNPYASPIAGPLSNLAKSFMTGPTEGQRIIQAETALKLQRQRQGVTDLASAFTQYGTPTFNRNAVMSSAVTGGYDPKDLAEMERYGAANSFGATDPRTTNASVGAGGAYGSTAHGFREGEANQTKRTQMGLDQKTYEFNNKPQTYVNPETNQPVIGTQSGAVGQRPVLSETDAKGFRLDQNFGKVGTLPQAEQRILGAEGKTQQTPRNYLAPGGAMHQTYDGITDARNGQPLPAGGAIAGVQGTPNESGLRPNVQSDLQKADIENQKFRGMLGYTRNLAKESAGNFGVAGTVKGIAQDVSQVADNLAKGLGYNGLQSAVEDAKQRAIAGGVDPNSLPGLFTFDPNLPSLHSAADLLVYSAASALAGQSGRSVSDKDVALFRDITGDPREWVGNQEKYLAKLNTIERMLDINQEVIDKSLRGGPAPAAPQAAPGAAPPQPPASGAPQISEGQTATNPQTGQKLLFRGGQWVPQ